MCTNLVGAAEFLFALFPLLLPGTFGAMGLGLDELLGMMTVSAFAAALLLPLLPPLLLLFMIILVLRVTELHTPRAPDSD